MSKRREGNHIQLILVHNRYRLSGGEERAVDEYQNLFKELGHNVTTVFADSKTISPSRAGYALLHGGYRLLQEQLSAAIRQQREPVVVHAHNIHPALGFRGLQTARAAGAHVVLHLHNYRLYCAVGTAFREGDVCTKCRKTTLPSLRHHCRGSLAESAVYALAIQRQRKHILAASDHIILPSETAFEQLKAFGFTQTENVSIIPNPLLSFAVQKHSSSQAGNYMLYVGRLSQEKGVDRVIHAAAKVGVPLVIAGKGEQEDALRQLAVREQQRYQREESLIRFVGWVDQSELKELYRHAAFLLMPSRCVEVYPYAVLEAMTFGLPVLASGTGSMSTFLPPELIVEQDDAWAPRMQHLWDNAQTRQHLGELLREKTELFSVSRVAEGLQRVWAAVLPQH